ncbi:hypothetical protein BgiBS90_010539 [Biomphalaria glabrata]|nr:hypothetical protein BgiBS90_010539 [Biomphalaria glabrata]
MDHDESENHPLDKKKPGPTSKLDYRLPPNADLAHRPFIDAQVGGAGISCLHQDTLDIVDGIRSVNSRPRSVTFLPAIEESLNEDKEDFGLSGSRSASSIPTSRLFFSGRVSSKPALTSISEERILRNVFQNETEVDSNSRKRSKALGDESKRGFSHGYGDVAADLRDVCEETAELMTPEKLQDLTPQSETPLTKPPLSAQAGGEGLLTRDDRVCSASVEAEDCPTHKIFEAAPWNVANENMDELDTNNNKPDPVEETNSLTDQPTDDLGQGTLEDSHHDDAITGDVNEPSLQDHSNDLVSVSAPYGSGANEFLDDTEPTESSISHELVACHDVHKPVEEPMDACGDVYFTLGEEQILPVGETCSSGESIAPEVYPSLDRYIQHIVYRSLCHVMDDVTMTDVLAALQPGHDLQDVRSQNSELSKSSTAPNSSRIKSSGSDSIISGSGDVSAVRESHSEHTADSTSSEKQDKDMQDKEVKKARDKETAGKPRGRERERNKRKKDRDDRASSTGKKKWLRNTLGHVHRMNNELMEGDNVGSLQETSHPQAKTQADTKPEEDDRLATPNDVVVERIWEIAKLLDTQETSRSEDAGDVRERNLKSTCGLESQTVTNSEETSLADYHDARASHRPTVSSDTEKEEEKNRDDSFTTAELSKPASSRLGKRTSLHRQKHPTSGSVVNSASVIPEQDDLRHESSVDQGRELICVQDIKQMEGELLSTDMSTYLFHSAGSYLTLGNDGIQTCTKEMEGQNTEQSLIAASCVCLEPLSVMYNESFNHPPKYLESTPTDCSRVSSEVGDLANEVQPAEDADTAARNRDSRGPIGPHDNHAEGAFAGKGEHELARENTFESRPKQPSEKSSTGQQENMDVSEYFTANNLEVGYDTGCETANFVASHVNLHDISEQSMTCEDDSFYELNCHKEEPVKDGVGEAVPLGNAIWEEQEESIKIKQASAHETVGDKVVLAPEEVREEQDEVQLNFHKEEPMKEGIIEAVPLRNAVWEEHVEIIQIEQASAHRLTDDNVRLGAIDVKDLKDNEEKHDKLYTNDVRVEETLVAGNTAVAVANVESEATYSLFESHNQIPGDLGGDNQTALLADECDEPECTQRLHDAGDNFKKNVSEDDEVVPQLSNLPKEDMDLYNTIPETAIFLEPQTNEEKDHTYKVMSTRESQAFLEIDLKISSSGCLDNHSENIEESVDQPYQHKHEDFRNEVKTMCITLETQREAATKDYKNLVENLEDLSVLPDDEHNLEVIEETDEVDHSNLAKESKHVLKDDGPTDTVASGLQSNVSTIVSKTLSSFGIPIAFIGTNSGSTLSETGAGEEEPNANVGVTNRLPDCNVTSLASAEGSCVDVGALHGENSESTPDISPGVSNKSSKRVLDKTSSEMLNKIMAVHTSVLSGDPFQYTTKIIAEAEGTDVDDAVTCSNWAMVSKISDVKMDSDDMKSYHARLNICLHELKSRIEEVDTAVDQVQVVHAENNTSDKVESPKKATSNTGPDPQQEENATLVRLVGSNVDFVQSSEQDLYENVYQTPFNGFGLSPIARSKSLTDISDAISSLVDQFDDSINISGTYELNEIYGQESTPHDKHSNEVYFTVDTEASNTIQMEGQNIPFKPLTPVNIDKDRATNCKSAGSGSESDVDAKISSVDRSPVCVVNTSLSQVTYKATPYIGEVTTASIVESEVDEIIERNSVNQTYANITGHVTGSSSSAEPVLAMTAESINHEHIAANVDHLQSQDSVKGEDIKDVESKFGNETMAVDKVNGIDNMINDEEDSINDKGMKNVDKLNVIEEEDEKRVIKDVDKLEKDDVETMTDLVINDGVENVHMNDVVPIDCKEESVDTINDVEETAIEKKEKKIHIDTVDVVYNVDNISDVDDVTQLGNIHYLADLNKVDKSDDVQKDKSDDVHKDKSDDVQKDKSDDVQKDKFDDVQKDNEQAKGEKRVDDVMDVKYAEYGNRVENVGVDNTDSGMANDTNVVTKLKGNGDDDNDVECGDEPDTEKDEMVVQPCEAANVNNIDEMNYAESNGKACEVENVDQVKDVENVDHVCNVQNVDHVCDVENVDEVCDAENVDQVCDAEDVDQVCDVQNVDAVCDNVEIVEEVCDVENVNRICDVQNVDQVCDVQNVDQICDVQNVDQVCDVQNVDAVCDNAEIVEEVCDVQNVDQCYDVQNFNSKKNVKKSFQIHKTQVLESKMENSQKVIDLENVEQDTDNEHVYVQGTVEKVNEVNYSEQQLSPFGEDIVEDNSRNKEAADGRITSDETGNENVNDVSYEYADSCVDHVAGCNDSQDGARISSVDNEAVHSAVDNHGYENDKSTVDYNQDDLDRIRRFDSSYKEESIDDKLSYIGTSSNVDNRNEPFFTHIEVGNHEGKEMTSCIAKQTTAGVTDLGQEQQDIKETADIDYVANAVLLNAEERSKMVDWLESGVDGGGADTDVAVSKWNNIDVEDSDNVDGAVDQTNRARKSDVDELARSDNQEKVCGDFAAADGAKDSEGNGATVLHGTGTDRTDISDVNIAENGIAQIGIAELGIAEHDIVETVASAEGKDNSELSRVETLNVIKTSEDNYIVHVDKTGVETAEAGTAGVSKAGDTTGCNTAEVGTTAAAGETITDNTEPRFLDNVGDNKEADERQCDATVYTVLSSGESLGMVHLDKTLFGEVSAQEKEENIICEGITCDIAVEKIVAAQKEMFEKAVPGLEGMPDEATKSQISEPNNTAATNREIVPLSEYDSSHGDVPADKNAAQYETAPRPRENILLHDAETNEDGTFAELFVTQDQPLMMDSDGGQRNSHIEKERENSDDDVYGEVCISKSDQEQMFRHEQERILNYDNDLKHFEIQDAREYFAGEVESEHISSEFESEHIDLEVESEHISSEVESEHIDLDIELEHNSREVESEHIDLEVESEHIDLEVESEHIDLEVESEHIDLEVESEHISREVKSEHIDLEVESEHISREVKSEHISREDEIEHIARQDESEYIVLEYASKPIVLENELENIARQDEVEHVALENESEHAVLKDNSVQIAIKDESEQNALQDELEHIAREDKSEQAAIQVYEEISEEQKVYEETSDEQKVYEEISDEQKVYEEISDEQKVYEETSDEQKVFIEISYEHKVFEEISNEQKVFEEISDKQKVFEEISDEQNVEEISYEQKVFKEICFEQKIYEEISDEQKVFEEISYEQNVYKEISDEQKVFEEISYEQKVYQDISDEQKVFEQLSDEQRVLEEISDEQKVFEEISDEQNVYKEISDEQKVLEEISYEQKVNQDISDEQKVFEEISDKQKLFEEISDEQKFFEEISYEQKVYKEIDVQKVFEEISDEQKVLEEISYDQKGYEEIIDEQKIFEEISYKKNAFEEISDKQKVFIEIYDEQKGFEEISDEPNVFEEISDKQNVFEEISDQQNFFEEISYEQKVYKEIDEQKVFEEISDEQKVLEEISYDQKGYEEIIDEQKVFEEISYKKNAFEEISDKQKVFIEISDEQKGFEEISDKQNVFEEISDQQNFFEEISYEQKVYEEISDEQNVFEEISDEHKVFEEISYEQKVYKEIDVQKVFEEISDEQKVLEEISYDQKGYEEIIDEQKVFEEISYKKNAFEEISDKQKVFIEISDEQKGFEEISDEPNVFEEISDKQNVFEEISDQQNFFEEISYEQKVYEEISDEQNVFEEISYEQKGYAEITDELIVFEEISDEQNVLEEISYKQKVFEEISDKEKVFEEIADEQKVFEEISNKQKVFDDISDEQKVFDEISDEQKVFEEISDEQKVFEEISDEQNVFEEISYEQKGYAEITDELIVFEEIADEQKVFQEISDEQNVLEEISYEQKVFEEISDEQKVFEEISDEQNVFEEISYELKGYAEITDELIVFEEISVEQKVFEEISDEQKVFEEISDEPNVFEEISDTKNVFEEISDKQKVFEEISDEQKGFEKISDEPNVYEEISDEQKGFEKISDEQKVYEDISNVQEEIPDEQYNQVDEFSERQIRIEDHESEEDNDADQSDNVHCRQYLASEKVNETIETDQHVKHNALDIDKDTFDSLENIDTSGAPGSETEDAGHKYIVHDVFADRDIRHLHFLPDTNYLDDDWVIETNMMDLTRRLNTFRHCDLEEDSLTPVDVPMGNAESFNQEQTAECRHYDENGEHFETGFTREVKQANGDDVNEAYANDFTHDGKSFSERFADDNYFEDEWEAEVGLMDITRRMKAFRESRVIGNAVDLTSPNDAPLLHDLTSSSDAPLLQDLTSPNDAPLLHDLTSSSDAPLLHDLTSPNDAPLLHDLTSSSDAPLLHDLTSPSDAPLLHNVTSPNEVPLLDVTLPNDDQVSYGVTVPNDDQVSYGVTLPNDDQVSYGVTVPNDDQVSYGVTLPNDDQVSYGVTVPNDDQVSYGVTLPNDDQVSYGVTVPNDDQVSYGVTLPNDDQVSYGVTLPNDDQVSYGVTLPNDDQVSYGVTVPNDDQVSYGVTLPNDDQVSYGVTLPNDAPCPNNAPSSDDVPLMGTISSPNDVPILDDVSSPKEGPTLNDVSSLNELQKAKDSPDLTSMHHLDQCKHFELTETNKKQTNVQDEIKDSGNELSNNEQKRVEARYIEKPHNIQCTNEDVNLYAYMLHLKRETLEDCDSPSKERLVLRNHFYIDDADEQLYEEDSSVDGVVGSYDAADEDSFSHQISSTVEIAVNNSHRHAHTSDSVDVPHTLITQEVAGASEEPGGSPLASDNAAMAIEAGDQVHNDAHVASVTLTESVRLADQCINLEEVINVSEQGVQIKEVITISEKNLTFGGKEQNILSLDTQADSSVNPMVHTRIFSTPTKTISMTETISLNDDVIQINESLHIQTIKQDGAHQLDAKPNLDKLGLNPGLGKEIFSEMKGASDQSEQLGTGNFFEHAKQESETPTAEGLFASKSNDVPGQPNTRDERYNDYNEKVLLHYCQDDNDEHVANESQEGKDEQLAIDTKEGDEKLLIDAKENNEELIGIETEEGHEKQQALDAKIYRVQQQTFDARNEHVTYAHTSSEDQLAIDVTEKKEEILALGLQEVKNEQLDTGLEEKNEEQLGVDAKEDEQLTSDAQESHDKAQVCEVQEVIDIQQISDIQEGPFQEPTLNYKVVNENTQKQLAIESQENNKEQLVTDTQEDIEPLCIETKGQLVTDTQEDIEPLCIEAKEQLVTDAQEDIEPLCIEAKEQLVTDAQEDIEPLCIEAKGQLVTDAQEDIEPLCIEAKGQLVTDAQEDIEPLCIEAKGQLVTDAQEDIEPLCIEAKGQLVTDAQEDIEPLCTEAKEQLVTDAQEDIEPLCTEAKEQLVTDAQEDIEPLCIEAKEQLVTDAQEDIEPLCIEAKEQLVTDAQEDIEPL